MEIVTGAIPSVLHKLGELLVGEYNLQKEVKGVIIFLQAELESMQATLEKISRTSADKIDDQDKIWAIKVKRMSYDLEDNIDKYFMQFKEGKMAEQHSIKEAIDRILEWLSQPMIRRKIATEIREIKSRVMQVRERRQRYEIILGVEVHERRQRYEFSHGVDKNVTMDPRLFAQFTEVKELVGIDEARDELISKIMIEENEVTKKQGRIVSIVGFGGLGKTTLANAVYKKIRAQFDCYAFVSVSQTPDLTKLYRGLLYDLSKSINGETLDESRLIEVLREFLKDKRYFVVVDDVWDISVWEMIRFALPDNDVGYTIITTTRISHVAEQAGGAYNMKPLSLNNSRKLLYRRIFGHGNKDNNEEEEKCPHEELAEVSDRILKKCAGVPLAIIVMARLLACKARDEMEWYEVYNSVGTGLENNLDVENMRKILSFSYYELPCHLRTCLLYLSMFPEDCEIEKDVLIRMWIGEGFIQCEKPGKSLFELGESYFNELINRSMIQPLHKNLDGMISRCHVHGMMLDLIRSKSREEDFVTVFNDKYQTYSSEKRLSFQNIMVDHARHLTSMNMQQVRSVAVFRCALNLMPALLSFRVLRVLDLQDCHLSQHYILKDLGNLIHLRYLGLRRTHITQLPEEIGNLQVLQTLDVTGNGISMLPSTVVQLKHLMFLRIDSWTRAPNGIGSLTCLEELSTLCIHDSTDIIKELGHLRKLRVLGIDCRTLQNNSFRIHLVECLHKLQHIESLSISVFGECDLDAWIAPRHLNRLELMGCWSSKLSYLINPFSLLGLSFLSIELNKLQQEDLEILGRLPALTYVDVEVNHENLGIRRLIIGASSFPCLVQCVLRGSIGPVAFQQGAMPRLESLCFTFPVLKMREISNCDGNFDLGLGNLQSLRNVTVSFLSGGASEREVDEAEAALRNEIAMHHNHPSLEIH